MKKALSIPCILACSVFANVAIAQESVTSTTSTITSDATVQQIIPTSS